MSANGNMDLEQAKVSKCAKRRQKRKEAKARQDKTVADGNSNFPLSQDPINILREKMEKAKLENNHAEVNKLRQQIWLLQDAAAGVASNVTEEQIESILKETTNMKDVPEDSTVKLSSATPITLSESRKQLLEKKLRKLEKKKLDVENLKERIKKGEKLEKTQLLKVEREKSIDDEIVDVKYEIFELKTASK